MVNQLIEILGREATLFESFLELLEKQKAALVANDLETIKSVTRDQQALLTQSRELAEKRERLVEQIRVENDLDEDITISRLLQTVDEQKAGQLALLRDTLLGLNQRITETRNSNAMLLNQSRQFISRTMHALARLNNPEVTYSARPSNNDQRSTIAVDRRA